MFLFKKSSNDNSGVPCRFGYSFKLNDVYTCFISNQRNISNHITKLNVLTPHSGIHDNNSVLKVVFTNCNLATVPSGLKVLFPNLIALEISSLELSTVKKRDLNEYKHLKTIKLEGINLQYLPSDLFSDFVNIEYIKISCNSSAFIEPGIFDGLPNLKRISLFADCDNSIYFNADNNDQGPSLEDVKVHLCEQFIKRFKQVQELTKSLYELQVSEHKLSQEIDNLKKTNENQKKDNEKTINVLMQKIASLEARLINSKEENKQLRTYGDRQKQENQRLKKSETKLIADNKELRNIMVKNERQIQQLNNIEKKLSNQVKQLKASECKLMEKNKKLEIIKESLAFDLTSYIKDTSTVDFKIIINEQEFPIHKFLIMSRCPTLADVLKNNPDAENLKLIDIRVEVFQKILNFLYTDELPRGDGINFLELFTAAGKLKINKLVIYAADNLIGHVDADNALTILPVAVSFKLNDLKLKAFEMLKAKYSDVKFEDEWIENPEKLIKVVAMLKKKEEILKKLNEEFEEVTSSK